MGLGTNSNKVVKTKYREFNCRAIPKCGRYFYKPNKEFNINILKFPTCKQFVPKALKTRGKKKECPKVFVSFLYKTE